MKKFKLNLQMFADGASASTGSENGASEGIANEANVASSHGKEDLSDVIYGNPQTEDVADSQNDDNTKSSPKDKSQTFEELIKGEYKDEFTKRTQGIIDKRFKEAKKMEATLKSHGEIFNMLADKYGVDATDVDALTKALSDDDSFYEEEALRQGLTVEQLKHMKSIERENEAFKAAQAEAEANAAADEIYSQWEREAQELSERYGIEIDLESEIQNPDFMALISSPSISFEGAFKAVHLDDLMGGAMARTAQNVTEKLANSIQSRQGRPSENGVSPSSSKVFKNDPSKFTNKDFEEIERRVARGEIISF